MKLIALGDTHGRKNWLKIVAKGDFDKIIFIGDYFDTHEDTTPQGQLQNFKDIIAYKKANIDKVVLLFGNHDYHYLPGVKEHYSGYQSTHAIDFGEAIKQNIHLLQICYQHQDFLFTHAGITKTWCNIHKIDNGLNDDIEKNINELFKYKPSVFGFQPGERMSGHGDDITQSPIWVRPRSLYQDKIDGYVQVVGHTTQDKIAGLNGGRKVWSGGVNFETSGVILIDTLGESGQYLSINNGIPIAEMP